MNKSQTSTLIEKLGSAVASTSDGDIAWETAGLLADVLNYSNGHAVSWL